MSSSGVPIRFKSSTYTAIIVSIISNFLIKTHGQIRLFTYISFNKYSLKRIYYMRLDCFNSYRDLRSLIEYMFRGFGLVASSNLNPLKIFTYMSISIDPYKLAVTTSMRRISSPSETIKLIKYQNVIVSIIGE